jgi:hypothetical protein
MKTDIHVKVGNKITPVTVVKDNPRTWWVRLPDGNVVKRHKVKHAPIG